MRADMHDNGRVTPPAAAWGLALLFAAGTVLFRVIPYLWDVGAAAQWVWNFAPVGALALYAGARLRPVGAALLLPVAAMLASDLWLRELLGPTALGWSRPVIYGCFVLYVVLGLPARGTRSPLRIGAGAVLGGVIFFVVSNFIAWAGGDGELYPQTWAGLGECYVAALPFYRNTLAGDLLFSGLFFGLDAVAALVLERPKASQPA
jgi:hypothetical protein